IPMIATVVLLHLLRWMHIGIINFKVFVLIIMVWSLMLILFYYHTRTGRSTDQKTDAALEAGMSSDD
ncbi:MAG TPA: hypothetical protein VLR50_18865, partial [Desulfobacterales bacterium]|nr:hypothetical protein [Desulfobacterales bacterium]